MKIFFIKTHPHLLVSTPKGVKTKNLKIDDEINPSNEIPLKYSVLLKQFNGNHKNIRNFLLKFGEDWTCMNGNLYYSSQIIYSK